MVQVTLQMWSSAFLICFCGACSTGAEWQNVLHVWIKHFVVAKRNRLLCRLCKSIVTRRELFIPVFLRTLHLCDRCTFSVWDAAIISRLWFFRCVFIAVAVSPIISLRLSRDKNASFSQRQRLRWASCWALWRVGSHAAPCTGRTSDQDHPLIFFLLPFCLSFICESLRVKARR